MGRVLTNNIGLSYSIETELGVPGTDWAQLEPNSIGTFGAEITTVARDPISPNRQRRKGTVTDLDSSVEFEHDFTLSVFRDFIEGFAFVTGINSDVSQLKVSAAETATDTYSLSVALNATQAEKFEVDTLVWVTGGLDPANNGLKVLDTDAADTDTALAVADNLVDETADFRISFAGHRVDLGDTVTWAWDSGAKQGTLSSTGIATILAQLGLTAGQMVHIGSIASLGGSIQNAFENSAANDMYGYARYVSSSDANTAIFDKVDATLQFSDGTSPSNSVDIVFGEFIRNVPVSNSDFLERSFHFENSLPNLGSGAVGNTNEIYQYAKGNFCSQVQFGLPLTDKATFNPGFIGTDTDNPTTIRAIGAGLTFASGVLTFAANATDGDTVTIGSTTYILETTLTDSADNVHIGGTASDTIDNLIAAITAGAGAGTDYGTGTVANAEATASAGAGDTMDVTAIVAGPAGNEIATTTTGSDLDFTGLTLSEGYPGATVPTQTGALNTSSDIARLRITEVDEDGITTDFKSLTLTLNNNVSPEKVLGQLGAKFINTGNFEVSVEAQLLFTNPLVINKIRDNETVTMDFVVKNDDGVVAIDIPSMTLGGGGREFPVNESVLINTTGEAFGDSALNTSIGVSIFPIPLP